MRQIGIKILLLLISGITYGQNNNEFIDSIKQLVIQNKIPIYNSNYQRLKHDEISKQFVWTDTIINDVWTRPKFIDNIYREPFDGAAVTTNILLDTITDKENSNYISFFTTDYDDAGNFLDERVVFKIDKMIPNNNLLNKKTESKLKHIQKKWKNIEIKNLGEKMELDSCHKQFRIEFYKNRFRQYYLPSNYECFTEEMKNYLKVGIEGHQENFDKYYDKVGEHYIENPKGKWFTHEDKLYLETENGLPIVTFVITKLTNKKLYLRSDKLKYEIKFKEACR